MRKKMFLLTNMTSYRYSIAESEKKMNSGRREVRPARPEDRDPVLAFCKDTWSWGDYIEYQWDDWLHDPDGCLLVATIDGQQVGIVNMCMLTATDAWLKGLRVAPQFRRQGLAEELNNAALLEAMQRGAKYARLLIESDNTASIRVAGRFFMRQVAGFSLLTATPQLNSKLPGQDKTQLATLADLDEIINYLNASNIFPLSGGLYYVSWTAYPITAELLEAKIKAQQIYLLRRWNRLDGLAIAEVRQGRQGRQLSIGYIDGTTIEPISLIAYDLRRQLADLAADSIHTYIPDILLLREALTGVGYEWNGNLFYTYERGLE
jgi:RimJ/RimL family protein N-acetyltransferase